MANADGTRPDAGLIAALEAARLHPLWTRYKTITPVHPQAKDAPMHWRWRDIETMADRAAREVPIEDVERRALTRVQPPLAAPPLPTPHPLPPTTLRPPPHN